MVTSVRQRGLEQILAALTTTERVSTALRTYPDRDKATEVLEDDLAIQRQQLVDELRAILRPHARAALSDRVRLNS
jgi:hypothetical protein